MLKKDVYEKPEVKLEQYEPVSDILTASGEGLEYGNTDGNNEP